VGAPKPAPWSHAFGSRHHFGGHSGFRGCTSSIQMAPRMPGTKFGPFSGLRRAQKRRCYLLRVVCVCYCQYWCLWQGYDSHFREIPARRLKNSLHVVLPRSVPWSSRHCQIQKSVAEITSEWSNFPFRGKFRRISRGNPNQNLRFTRPTWYSDALRASRAHT
jgi:hypothetical protein